MTVQAGDEVSRCIIYNRSFKNNVHINSALLIFPSPPDENGVYHESGVLRRLASSDADVHRIGCKIASIQNGRKNDPPRGPKRRYYCGFRSAMYDELPLSGDSYEVTLTLDNEGGEAAHVDIALTVPGSTTNERSTNKLNAGLALAYEFGDPIEHICEVDKGDEHHPLRAYPGCLTADLSVDAIYISHQEKKTEVIEEGATEIVNADKDQ